MFIGEYVMIIFVKLSKKPSRLTADINNNICIPLYIDGISY